MSSISSCDLMKSRSATTRSESGVGEGVTSNVRLVAVLPRQGCCQRSVRVGEEPIPSIANDSSDTATGTEIKNEP